MWYGGSGARVSRPVPNDRAEELSRTQSAGEAFSREASGLGESNGRRGALSTDTHDHANDGERPRGKQYQQSKMGGWRVRDQDRRNGEDWGTISVNLWWVSLGEACLKHVLVSTYEIFES